LRRRFFYFGPLLYILESQRTGDPMKMRPIDVTVQPPFTIVRSTLFH